MAGWVHRDISTGNIIVVENNGCIRGFLSDFEYAKAMSNQSSSSDPKTVCFDTENRYCLTSDQGTPYFMPLEIHLGEKCAESPANSPFQSMQEIKQYVATTLLHPPNPPITILRYNYHHDHESLMWVALYIVFGRVYWAEAQKIWPKIFANSRRPNQERMNFFRKKNSSYMPDFSGAFHSELCPVFPLYFEMIRNHLWYMCNQLELREEDYHKLFNTLIFSFDQLLTIATEKAEFVRFVEKSGQANIEVEEPRKKKKTEHTPHPMETRKRTELSDGKVSGGEGLDVEGSEPLRMRL